MITYSRKVGRLVEIRVRGDGSVSQFGKVIALANELGPDAKVVVLSDVREGAPLTPEQTTRLATIQRANSQRVERMVALLKEGRIPEMVARRLQAESGLDARMVSTPADALAALAPVLNAAELARARQFLEEK